MEPVRAARDTSPSPTLVRFHGDLPVVAGDRCQWLEDAGPRSVKDAVEAAGAPHTEVGNVLVDGAEAGFTTRLAGGEVVDVHPPSPGEASPLWPAPPRPPRFVADVHLGTLARRLRLLGFDAWYRNDAVDTELAAIAARDARILVSRDRGLLKRRSVVHGYCPRSDEPEEQALELARRYGLAVQATPMTRCVRCNGVLEAASRHQVADAVPARSFEAFDTFARCTACGHVVWPGSHLEALAGFLRRFAATGRSTAGLTATIGPD